MVDSVAMQGSSLVIDTLKSAAAAEAQLNLQSSLYTRKLKYLGVGKVAKKVCEIGDNTHWYLKKVTDRILFLEGDLTYTLPPIADADTLTQILLNLQSLETALIKPYEEAVQTAMAAFDDTTRNMFEHLLKWHQKELGWLEQQLSLIEKLGEDEYIAEKL